MVKNIYRPVLVLACAAVAGCGGGSPKELPVAKSAHGGTIVTLPNDRGFAEILVDSESAKDRARKAQVKSRLVAYFYQSDGSSALSPDPTDVKIQIGMGGDGRLVDLAKESKEAGKFASAAGAYPDGFAGQLRASLDGQAVEVPVRVR
jgi:hypothetical protein